MSEEYDDDVDDNDETGSDEQSEQEMIDNILEDEGYTDETYDEEERELLEEGEEEETDDDTKDEEDEDENQEEEDDELESLLELSEEQDTEEEDTQEVDNTEITDEHIANAVFLSKNYDNWMDAADEDGRQIDEKFAAMVGRNRIPQDVLTENGIYSMKDMYGYMEGLRENQDPDRLVVPDPEADPEQWETFLEEGFNIPKEAEGYDDKEIFAESYLEEREMEDVREDYKAWFAEHKVPRETAYHMIQKMDQERENYIDSKMEEDREFVEKQRLVLQREFREDYNSAVKDFNNFLDKFMPGFREKYANDRVLRDADFVRGVIRALNNSASPESLQLNAKGLKIQTVTNEGLDYWRKSAEKLVAEREKWKDSSNKGLQRKYRFAKIQLNKVNDEIRKRGLVEV